MQLKPKRPNRTRAAGIMIHEDSLLVMFRRQNGREYYTFPGGMIEEGETPKNAAAREIQEETTISVEVGELLYELHRVGTLPQEFFYRCIYQSGTPTLATDSIEQQINDPEHNFFEPRLVGLSEIGDISLLPVEVALRLRRDIEHGFADAPVILEGAPIQ